MVAEHSAVGVTQPSKDEVHQQDKEPLPTVIRRKRGRPPRARMSYNPANGVALSTAGTSSQVDQVAGFHGGRIQLSTSSGEHVVEAAAAHHHVLLPERSPDDDKLTFTEARGDFEYGSSPAIVSKTATHSMRELKTPLWLVDSPADDLLPEGCVAGGGTRTYERRRSGLSPQSHSGTPSGTQDDGSDGEPFSEHLDFCYDEDELLPAAERRFRYESVSVPIRTFPSQFASRGDHNTPPGTFIPVETIVVNSQPKSEDLDEFLVPESETRAHSERREQKCGGKLLLRLKLPKKKMLPGAACAVETSQPFPASSPIQLPGGGLLPPAFTVSEQISKEVSRFEQFENEPLKQSDSTMGSHCFPVPVS